MRQSHVCCDCMKKYAGDLEEGLGVMSTEESLYDDNDDYGYKEDNNTEEYYASSMEFEYNFDGDKTDEVNEDTEVEFVVDCTKVHEPGYSDDDRKEDSNQGTEEEKVEIVDENVSLQYATFMQNLNEQISQDTTFLYHERPCKDMNSLLNHSIDEWLGKRPVDLKKHLKLLCGLDYSKKSKFLLAKMIEQIYACRNSKLVLPLAFRENVVSYKIANSPKLSAINCASKPSGGQTFLNQWLNKSAEAPLSVPSGLVRCIFDNNQVIGKRYRVKANKTSVPASVITSHACIMIDSNNHVQ